jgi:hypothetical protein
MRGGKEKFDLFDPNAHNRFSKDSFIIHKMLLQILVARFTHENMRERERMREILA